MEAVLQRPRAVAELDLDAFRHALPENQRGRLATLLDIGFELVDPFGELRVEVGRCAWGGEEGAGPGLRCAVAAPACCLGRGRCCQTLLQ
jgi:hypothetical protein